MFGQASVIIDNYRVKAEDVIGYYYDYINIRCPELWAKENPHNNNWNDLSQDDRFTFFNKMWGKYQAVDFFTIKAFVDNYLLNENNVA